MLDNEQKVVLVTGASRGIGAKTAKLLGSSGYYVCINYLSSDSDARSVLQQITKNGGKAEIFRKDLGKEDDIVSLFNQIDLQVGPVNCLVNNAGIVGGFSEIDGITFNDLTSLFNLNFFGTLICIREAVKRMKKIGFGQIVNISSESAKFGGQRITPYACSKAAVNTATVSLSKELAKYNIRVNAVSPGVIETDMQKNLSPEKNSSLVDSIPFKRMGNPLEVANVIKWLLSDNSSYISGAIIPVSGAR